MDFGLKGKIAVVTGATEGIGKASALLFAREGAKVAICARKQDGVDKTLAEIKQAGGDAFGMAADMSKMEDIDRFMNAVVKHFGAIDILVNNAGTSARGAFLEIADDTWHHDIELKVFGAIRCTRLAVPHMKKRGGGRVVRHARHRPVRTIPHQVERLERVPVAVEQLLELDDAEVADFVEDAFDRHWNGSPV